MANAENVATVQVEVAYARPDRQWLVALVLPAGSTAAEAVAGFRHSRGLPRAGGRITDCP